MDEKQRKEEMRRRFAALRAKKTAEPKHDEDLQGTEPENPPLDAQKKQGVEAKVIDDEKIEAQPPVEEMAAPQRHANFEPFKKPGMVSISLQMAKQVPKKKRLAAFEVADDEEIDAVVPKKPKAASEWVTERKEAPGEDPLDAFMINIKQEVESVRSAENHQQELVAEVEEEVDVIMREDTSAVKQEDDDVNIMNIINQALKSSRRKDYVYVDHAQVEYEAFRKNFYIEAPEITRMTEAEVEEYRKEIDNIKIHGRKCPRPVKRFAQCGLPIQCELVIKQLGYEKPTPIQAQCLPAIMSGRDVIGVAKTGSGKTMAFLLPLFRHIKDQRPLAANEGPIALILAPTRELAIQIYNECKRFTKLMGLRVACAYGGAPLKDQIAEMKRGAEIVVSTPGRYIDLLCANSGRVTNLKRVTYLTIDEADRMFDMGFEQQVAKLVLNIRPDAQRVLFSATFPKQMEALARSILRNPLEIIVGGKSVVSRDIKQYVEVKEDEDKKFTRLLELLGEWYDPEKDQRMLIFVERQEAGDNLLRELLRRGYPCSCIHGGKDQMDRDSTIQQFKNGVFQVMIATSVAARGLDVKECNVVVNYDCPNHMEDYVHRCGRTGRAGKKGTAYTFITYDQSKYAPDIVKALVASKTRVPVDVKELADNFMDRVKRGEAYLPGSGFGGKGLEQIERERESFLKAQKAAYGDDELEPHAKQVVEDDEEEEDTGAPNVQAALSRLNQINEDLKSKGIDTSQSGDAIMEKLNIQTRDSAGSQIFGDGKSFSCEIEINDLPPKIRERLLNREFHLRLAGNTGCAITVRGSHIPPEKRKMLNERGLHMIINGHTYDFVDQARRNIFIEMREALEDPDFPIPSGVPGARYPPI